MQKQRKQTFDSRIKNCWQAISRMYNAEATKYGLTANIGFVLINIDKDNGTTASQLAPLLGMEITSLTRILNSIEQKKLIVRKTDKLDKRVTRIFLTEKGKQKREISKTEVKKFNQDIGKLVGEKKLHDLFETMDKINEFVLEKERNLKAK